jgi:hypothetical protein
MLLRIKCRIAGYHHILYVITFGNLYVISRMIRNPWQVANELDVFHSYVGGFLVRKVSFSRCVIVWCRPLLNRLILKEYENTQFYLPVNTFRLRCKVQPVNVFLWESYGTLNQYIVGKMQRFLMLKPSSNSAQSISSTYIVISLPCVWFCVPGLTTYGHDASAALPLGKVLHTPYIVRVPSETDSGRKSQRHCR